MGALGEQSTAVDSPLQGRALHCLEESGYPSASQPLDLVLQATEETSTQPRVGPGRSTGRSGPASLAWAAARLHPLSSAPQLSLKTALPVEAGVGASVSTMILSSGICFRASPGLPGGGVGQDGCEATDIGKVLQQGLDDG